jgi:hypothetical protein
VNRALPLAGARQVAHGGDTHLPRHAAKVVLSTSSWRTLR